MASSVIKRIQDNAEKLSELRKAISAREESNKVELEALKVNRDALQALLIADMNKNGLASIKVSSGDTFSKSVRKGIEVVDETRAFKWAIDNFAVSINKVLVAQKLKDASDMPDCFKTIETEFISVRSNKNKDE